MKMTRGNVWRSLFAGGVLFSAQGLVSAGDAACVAPQGCAPSACAAPEGDCVQVRRIDCNAVFKNAEDELACYTNKLAATCEAQQAANCTAPTDPCAPTDPNSCDGAAASEDAGFCIGGNDPFDLGNELKKAMGNEESPWDIGGWASFGYTNKSDGVFNTVPNRFNLHQGWLFMERTADGSKGLDWGFRADLLYGLDGENTQSYGNNPGNWDFQNGWDHGVYHWAFPQLYGTIAFDKWMIKAGHFYTSHGYEVVPAPGNFFYSHAFTFNFSEPFTHTGVHGTYKASDKLELYAGWLLGWDTGFDQFQGGSAAHGGFKYNFTDKVNLIYVTTFGDNGWIGDGYTHSIVGTVGLTDKLTYVLSSDLVQGNRGVFGGTTYHTVSAANYLLYQFTKNAGAGVRAEWFKANGVSYQEVTMGLNVKPAANWTIRPEVRYQWSPGVQHGGPNPIGVPVDQWIFGIDTILTF